MRWSHIPAQGLAKQSRESHSKQIEIIPICFATTPIKADLRGVSSAQARKAFNFNLSAEDCLDNEDRGEWKEKIAIVAPDLSAGRKSGECR